MKVDKEFKPWRLDWTSEHVQHFWDWWGSNPALLKHYFSKRNGEAVIDHIHRHVRFTGTIVDLGAGPGISLICWSDAALKPLLWIHHLIRWLPWNNV